MISPFIDAPTQVSMFLLKGHLVYEATALARLQG